MGDSVAVILWAAPGGTTLESSPGCNPGFAEAVRRTPAGVDRKPPLKPWPERMSPRHPGKVNAQPGTAFFPPLPGFWSLCLDPRVAPGATLQCRPSRGCPEDHGQAVFHPLPSSFVIRHSSFVIRHSAAPASEPRDGKYDFPVPAGTRPAIQMGKACTPAPFTAGCPWRSAWRDGCRSLRPPTPSKRHRRLPPCRKRPRPSRSPSSSSG